MSRTDKDAEQAQDARAGCDAPRRGFAAGAFFIAIGVFFLLRAFGLLRFSWEGFATYWPIGLIVIGLALIFRQRWLAFATIFIMIVLGVTSLTTITSVHAQDYHQEVAMSGAQALELRAAYGAGELRIGAGASDVLVRNDARSAREPRLTINRDGTSVKVDIAQEDGSIFGAAGTWNLSLAPGVPTDISLHYGAASAIIDLRGLDVRSLAIESGAASSTITFDAAPMSASIKTGASSLVLRFPKSANARVRVTGGAISKHLDGFHEEGDTYTLGNANASVIDVAIDAGASDVRAELY